MESRIKSYAHADVKNCEFHVVFSVRLLPVQNHSVQLCTQSLTCKAGMDAIMSRGGGRVTHREGTNLPEATQAERRSPKAQPGFGAPPALGFVAFCNCFHYS